MKHIKQSRLLSFIAVTLIYVIAAVIGILTYQNLELDWWLSLLIADTAATVVTFIFSLIFGNASVYDPYWSVQPIVILAAFAIGRRLTAFSIVLLIIVCIWGVRLTLNWAYTFANLEHQDWRYTMLKDKCGAFYPLINFIGIHMVPTVIVYLVTIPGVYAIINGLEGNAGSYFFLLVSLLAVVLQGTSDYQMHRFRKNRTSTFIRVGFWKHSRHPNYLGEILMWWGIALAVFSASANWYLAIGAFANTLLFLAVSVPLADGRQSSKEGFEEYKSETRMLLPIPKSGR